MARIYQQAEFAIPCCKSDFACCCCLLKNPWLGSKLIEFSREDENDHLQNKWNEQMHAVMAATQIQTHKKINTAALCERKDISKN